MRRLLQNESHQDVPYDRPNLPWVCGLACEGCPCRVGPTPKGECPEGRCRPARSQRVRRGRLAIIAALFVIGALAFFIGSPWRNEVLAPGSLTQAHAQILSGDANTNRCAACHPGGAEAALGLAPTDDLHASQSLLCVECHKSLIEPTLATNPHGLPMQVFQGNNSSAPASPPTQNAELAAALSSFTLGNAPGEHTEVACAACHQEHHGAEHALSAISDGRCQACHQQRYDSFASDHPDFGLWPYRRRTRINFDHNSHASKHYAVKGQAFACATCHVDAPGGDTKLLASYEQSCAACHDASIDASLGTGLAIISMPMMDEQAIRDAGGRLGAWPQAAKGDFDGELSAIAKLLLLADSKTKPAIDRLGGNFSFFDFDPDSRADVRDALLLANGIRSLIGGLAKRGHAEVFDRVEKLGASPESDLAGALPVTAVDEIRVSWFGGSDATAGAPPAVELAGRQVGGGWFVDDRGLALRYRPQGHADPMLRAWIDLAASLGPEHAELREAALAELAGPNSPGRCATCHSIDQQPDFHRQNSGELIVHWQALGATHPRAFTRFSHRPHVNQPQLADCTHCHALDPTADRIAAPYASREPTNFIAQFQPVTKSACIECHQPKAAGDSCTQCHHYHVDGRGFAGQQWLHTKRNRDN